MNFFLLLLLLTIYLAPASAEIVIKDGLITEVKKAEEEKPAEMPKPAQLVINVFNQTKHEFVLGLEARARGLKYRNLSMHQTSPPLQNLTIATFHDANPDTTFEFISGEVYIVTTVTDTGLHRQNCNLIKNESTQNPETNAAESDDTPQYPEVKKSIDFYFYNSPGQAVPSCLVKFDS